LFHQDRNHGETVGFPRGSLALTRIGGVVGWEIISGPREYKPRGGAAGRDLGWAYVIEQGNERLTVRVERAALLAESEGSTEVVRRAIATSGRSAVEAILDRKDPPRRLLIGTDGLTERAD
jgi:hypothetical protein